MTEMMANYLMRFYDMPAEDAGRNRPGVAGQKKFANPRGWLSRGAGGAARP